MSTNITTSRRNGDASPTDEERTELSELRRTLANKYEYVRDDDPELYREIDEWLRESVSLPDGSVGSAVKSRLRELKRGNKMRDHRRIDDPEEAFPDACEGCPHYGVACPMVKRYSVTKTMERILRTAESDEDVIEKLTDLAIEWDCHVVLDELEAYQDSYGDFLERGYELNARAVDTLSAGTGSETTDGVTTQFDEQPSPEDREAIEQTIDAVMGDEEGDAP
ncbi:hypothetical protein CHINAEXTREME_20490 (plasmid) [Halobiforma lacisalsi AJ5]|uniref:Uncharacterized protein n=1 Tax=Natronobacterium lacisalsi AJ5 TaxID=358396 RepID=M0LZ42_NATLA|nr:hypothetical protein [Halobiforma lacisalsi]APX00193.1 hypothetical protein CHINAEXTREME_20490 [Halobiforma lacisalsi AJ5]EMA37390.1 hypothetical protein C445_00836 [Halobiforma lacisalsi AJ5]